MIYLTQSQNPMAQVIQSCIDVFSVFVAVVLACLILYADRFLMQPAGRGAGHLSAGLSQGQVSLLLVLETGLIGAASWPWACCWDWRPLGPVRPHLVHVLPSDGRLRLALSPGGGAHRALLRP